MLKSITCAALAAVSFCAFAQSNYSTHDEVYFSDWALMSNPPTTPAASLSYVDLRKNVIMQSDEWQGGDKYELYRMLDSATGDVEYDLLKALYHVRNDANVARHDVLAQRVAAEEQLMMMPPTGQMIAQNSANGDFSEIGNRPMRMMLDAHNDNPNITYEDAADILEHAMSTAEATDFDNWYWKTADDAMRDTLVHVIKFDNWLKNRPIYVSTLTPDIAPTIAPMNGTFPAIPFTSGQ